MGIFSEIPPHNQMDVLKKLEFKDFVRFRKCSQETIEMTKNFRHKLYIKMDEISFYQDFFYGNRTKYKYEWFTREPVRLKIEEFHVKTKITDQGFCILEEFSQKTKLVATKLRLLALKEGCRNDPWMTDKLIKLLKVKILRFERYCSSVLAGMEELKNIKDICFAYGDTEEFDFLLLKQPNILFFDRNRHFEIYRKPFTPHVIKAFLKEWLELKREIQHVSVNFDFRVDLMEACSDFEISHLWSQIYREFHIQPRLEEHDGRVVDIFSIERKLDKKKLFLVIWLFFNDRRMVHRVDIREYETVEDIQEWIRTSMYFPS